MLLDHTYVGSKPSIVMGSNSSLEHAIWCKSECKKHRPYPQSSNCLQLLALFTTHSFAPVPACVSEYVTEDRKDWCVCVHAVFIRIRKIGACAFMQSS
jgi:hypothetical protein